MAAANDLPLDLPVTYLGYETITKLFVAMTVESANRRRDWRALGGTLGFNFNQIELMQQDRRYPCKGRLLIKLWEDTGNTSARRIIYALKELKMEECLNIIRQDPSLTEMDIQEALKEYEHLKANRLFHKAFPRISADKFNEALFPSVRMDSSTNSCMENELSEQAQDEAVLDERSIYISFCPESGLLNRKFNHQLRRFAQCLQDQEFVVHFEPNCQFQIQRSGGVVLWKEACIRKSKNIIVICTPEYYKEDVKAIDGTKKSTRSKIGVDSQYLRQLAFNGTKCRIVPVVLDARIPSLDQFPMWVQPLVRYSWPSCERNLLLCLEDLPHYILPKADPKRRKIIKPIVINMPDFG